MSLAYLFHKQKIRNLAALILFAVAPGFACTAAHAQTNEWVWLGGGSDTPNQPGVYGTLANPAPGNIPGDRSSAAYWTDKAGNFWLFGGAGIDAAGNSGSLNDLWQFNPSTKQWAWMSGSNVLLNLGSVFGQPGVYGTVGTPASGNVPGSRTSPAAWTDSSGNLWLFGGYGPNASGYTEYLNDLWRFNPSTLEWTWMGGQDTLPTSESPGVYGSLGKPAPGNMPGPRYQAVSWADSSGNLWLFGGTGFDAMSYEGPLNDLWKFNISAGQWTWVAGSDTVGDSISCSQYTCARPGVYGSLGVFAAANTPGGRYGAANWTDSSGKLWLFGGTGPGSETGPSFFLNDLWEFDPSLGQWAWMSGSSSSGSTGAGIPGVYGTLGQPASGNRPGSRTSATTSVDSDGNFWLFGGWGYASLSQPNVEQNPGYLDDLWEYNLKANEWVWVGGSSTVPTYNQGNPGVYGVLGTPAATNLPGGRDLTAGWTDQTGNFWLFGGSGWSSDNTLSDLNDLWEFQATPISRPTPTFAVSGSSVSVAPGATTGNTSTITVTPNGGFTGSVTLTASVTSAPAGAQFPPSLSFVPSSAVTITGASSASAALAIATTAPTSNATNHPSGRAPRWLAGGAVLSCLLFLGVPGRRRSWRTMLGMLALITVSTSGLSACGGGSGGGGGGHSPGTTPGLYTVTVTSTSSTISATTNITVTVQ